jgi:hypothetical protein
MATALCSTARIILWELHVNKRKKGSDLKGRKKGSDPKGCKKGSDPKGRKQRANRRTRCTYNRAQMFSRLNIACSIPQRGSSSTTRFLIEVVGSIPRAMRSPVRFPSRAAVLLRGLSSRNCIMPVCGMYICIYIYIYIYIYIMILIHVVST